MRQSARLLLIEALRKAHRWLDEVLTDPRQTVEAIATRESKSKRSIRMTLSLGFLAPDIVKAATEGRLPRGFGLTRLIDLPIVWSDQWKRSASKRLRASRSSICPQEGPSSRGRPGRCTTGASDLTLSVILLTCPDIEESP
jgi:hypothetical protein